MIALIKALQLMLSLSILVVLHEGGHFLFSKLFHVRVEKFFLFFDPYFHLFSTKDKWFTHLFPKFNKKETEYGIGWLPLGGYVKIAGMIDESMDTEQMKKPVQKWEFRAKPAWQRLLIMVGGVLVNFLLALFIYVMILFCCGEQYIATSDMTMGFRFNKQAKEIGFKDGDVPLSADGKKIEKWEGSVYRTISEAHYVTVLRAGKEITLNMPANMNLLEMVQATPPFLVPFVPCIVDSVLPNSPAQRAGLKAGSTITTVDDKKMETWTDFDLEMQERAKLLAAGNVDSLKLRTIKLTYTNETTKDMDTTVVVLTPDLKLGIFKPLLTSFYEPVKRDYGFLASIPAGISYGIGVLTGYVSDLKYLFTTDGAKSVGSFITIGSIFPAVWDWVTFWETTAFLSLILAFMNILPIPALDGGHVLFLIAEIILRRPPGEKFMERAQMVGMTLLIALMVLACYNDIVRFVL